MTTTTPTKTPQRLLQDAREHAGLSREALARRVNVSLSTVQRLELNGAIPKSAVLFAIARVLEVNLDELADSLLADH